MKLAVAMFLGSVLGAALVTVWTERLGTIEIWLGMLAPASATSLEWIATERTARRSPELVSALMLRIFAGKALLFAGYIIAVLIATPVEPAQFVASFVGFFLVLFVAEAFALHRLLSAQRL